jgi:hypothetical protein
VTYNFGDLVTPFNIPPIATGWVGSQKILNWVLEAPVYLVIPIFGYLLALSLSFMSKRALGGRRA